MCYSNSNTSQLQAFKDKYKREIKTPEFYQPSFFSSGFTFPTWPIITLNEQVQFYHWGLLPHWMRDQDPKKFALNTLNAKAETLLEKPSFKHLVETNRCLIPSTGFFEYQTIGKEKRAFFIHAQTQPIFSFAGLYDTWVDPKTGASSCTFTMITCAANELMAEIHNDKKRMPVILTEKDEQAWLLGNDLSLLKPAPNDFLSAFTVDKKQFTPNNPLAQAPFIPPAIAEQGSLF